MTAAALGVLAVGSGCVRDPTVGDQQVAPSVSGPGAGTDLARHAAIQASLAAAAAGGAGGSQRLGAFRQRAALDLAAQAELLAPGASSPAAAGDFAIACRTASDQHLAADAHGITAARLASAGAYAGGLASLTAAATPRVPTQAESAESVPVLGDAEAMTGLLLQLYPAVYALEAALPWLAAEDAGWARTTLDGHLTARQVLLAELGRRSLRAPGAAVAYETGALAGAQDALGLVARVEAAVLPAACRLVRATGAEELRRTGGTVLRDATVAVARSGGALPVWPGWG